MTRLGKVFLLLLVVAVILGFWVGYTNADEPIPQSVQVWVDVNGGRQGGTGAYVEPGMVVTAQHVVEGRSGNIVEVHFPGGQVIQGLVEYAEDPPDVAIIELKRQPKCLPLPLRVTPLKVGERFVIEGYNAGKYKRSSGTLNVKRYNDVWRELDGTRPRSGDSGGPVLDMKGRYAGTLWGGSDNNTMFTPVGVVRGLIGE